MKERSEVDALSRHIKQAAAQISASAPLASAPSAMPGPRRLPLGRLVSVITLAFVLAAVTGFTLGRATSTTPVPTPNVNNAVIQAALQNILESFASGDQYPLTVQKITSVQVKEMTWADFEHGIGEAAGHPSAWKTGNAADCNSGPTVAYPATTAHPTSLPVPGTVTGAPGPKSSVIIVPGHPSSSSDMYVIAIYGQFTQQQQNSGTGDVIPAVHYTVATLEINADGPTSNLGDFGFGPVASNGTPVCWDDLPNLAG